MKKTAFFAACVAAALTGCTTYDYEGETLAANPDRVLIFNMNQAPNQTIWRKIGSAGIQRNARVAPEEILLNQMREEAGAVGADAMHITSTGVSVNEDGTPQSEWVATRKITADYYVHISFAEPAEEATEKAAE